MTSVVDPKAYWDLLVSIATMIRGQVSARPGLDGFASALSEIGLLAISLIRLY
jgi:hypothetical protein